MKGNPVARKINNLKAVGGGVSIASVNKPKAMVKSKAGNVVKASGAPLPSQKRAKGSGIAGRGK